MNWITVTHRNDIPSYIYTDRVKILLEDINGFIGVGYYNSYDWVLDTFHDIECEICFDTIKRYSFLD
jgi:hypothetical protein